MIGHHLVLAIDEGKAAALIALPCQAGTIDATILPLQFDPDTDFELAHQGGKFIVYAWAVVTSGLGEAHFRNHALESAIALRGTQLDDVVEASHAVPIDAGEILQILSQFGDHAIDIRNGLFRAFARLHLHRDGDGDAVAGTVLSFAALVLLSALGAVMPPDSTSFLQTVEMIGFERADQPIDIVGGMRYGCQTGSQRIQHGREGLGQTLALIRGAFGCQTPHQVLYQGQGADDARLILFFGHHQTRDVLAPLHQQKFADILGQLVSLQARAQLGEHTRLDLLFLLGETRRLQQFLLRRVETPVLVLQEGTELRQQVLEDRDIVFELIQYPPDDRFHRGIEAILGSIALVAPVAARLSQFVEQLTCRMGFAAEEPRSMSATRSPEFNRPIMVLMKSGSA